MNSIRTSRLWNASEYLKFGKERLRPALNLLAGIEMEEPSHVVDLGCGPGNLTPFLKERFPNSKITCFDSSPEMLKTAKEKHNSIFIEGKNIDYICGNFEDFHKTFASKGVDVIFSNAALHWSSSKVHETLIPSLLSCLNPEGTLAFQIPDTRMQPSHMLMREAGKLLGLESDLKDVYWVTCEQDANWYIDLFKNWKSTVDVNCWSTSYFQILEGENPVVNFTSSTGLGPYIDALGGKDTENGKRFLEKYSELIREAYPPSGDGTTTFEFKRFFAVVKIQ